MTTTPSEPSSGPSPELPANAGLPVPTLSIATRINGREQTLQIAPSETLAETLRGRLGLTGTKVSCDVQVCGACTVLVNGLPVSACTFLAYETRGKDVLTVEGLAPAKNVLHPLQQAFVDESAFQCGFCTPGMLLAAKSLLDHNPAATDEEIAEYMEGNLCRCTGYRPIMAAISRARDGLVRAAETASADAVAGR